MHEIFVGEIIREEHFSWFSAKLAQRVLRVNDAELLILP